MERCVDSDYPETQYDSPKSSETSSNSHSNTINDQKKNKSTESLRAPRARKKIAAEKRSVGRSDPGKNVVASMRARNSVRKDGKRVTKLNVLKSRLISARHGVQNNTKTLQRNVPDRLGKNVNSSFRPEINLLSNSVAEPPNDCSPDGTSISGGQSGIGFLLDCSETKLNMIGNECLSNKESVSLGNSTESDTETKHIFEKIFDDCLGSTSIVKDASSQEKINLEAHDESVAIGDSCTRLSENYAKKVENERTPPKKNREETPATPVKIKDHSNYYANKKVRHVCGYCHKIFKSNGKLNSHVYSHTGERPFDCNNCGKAFSSKFKLVRHLLIHSEIRKFVCQICDRTFLRNDHLKNHYKIHDPQKKMYKCLKEHCDKEYSSIMSHKKHMAYHSVEDGDLKCLICNVKFETKEDVLFHLKSHSGSRLFKSQSDKKFKCDFCDRLFLTRKDVTRHLVVHTGERDFLCQFCPQRFGRKDHLVRHIKKSHVSEGMTIKNEIKQLINQKEVEAKVKAPSPETSKKSDDDIETVNVEPGDSSRKTHIVITVKNPVQKRKWKSSGVNSKSKSFQKSDSTVPNRKQVPLSKNNCSTTQIFLQNIPNILIIPNNSIILLRNQSSGKAKKTAEDNSTNDDSGSINNSSDDVSTPSTGQDNSFQLCDDILSVPRTDSGIGDDSMTPLQSDSSFNYNYNSSVFQNHHQYPLGDAFCNFQPEMSLENLNLEVSNQDDQMKRFETESFGLDSKNLENIHPPDMHRKVGIVKPITKTFNPCEVDKEDLFEGVAENLIITDSMLNDFKVDDSGILPMESDGGILNNIFSQSGVDGTGNELLRNLLLSENPMLPPLPGFSQIFQNTNTN